MVAAVENLTWLQGVILARMPHERLAGWDEVTVELTGTQSVPGKADLVSARRGTGPLRLAVRSELLGDAAPGARLTVRAKVAVGEVLAESHPDPADFQVVPAGPSGDLPTEPADRPGEPATDG
ncbi:MAG TPA: hypothetical protein VFJ97_00570 [Dermatophilaceae bacterium]|nr:hypothetical protein [Dermatophilaceae bacterium]